MCKRFKFNYTARWHTHKPESALENETHKIIWDPEIQTDHQIPVRRQNLVIVKKKKKKKEVK